MRGQSASLSAIAWRTVQTAVSNTVGGVAVYLSTLLIELDITPPATGGLLDGLAPIDGGLLPWVIPDRQAAEGVTRAAR